MEAKAGCQGQDLWATVYNPAPVVAASRQWLGDLGFDLVSMHRGLWLRFILQVPDATAPWTAFASCFPSPLHLLIHNRDTLFIHIVVGVAPYHCLVAVIPLFIRGLDREPDPV